ncbi:MAG: hypothetical protein QM539_02150 [Alphaproteobacteria bacterium]|nr:hypothetical protein [Alphaproteobacteria bacterium]
MKIILSVVFCLFIRIWGHTQMPLEGHWRGYIVPLDAENLKSPNLYDFDVYIQNHKIKGYRAITVAKNKQNYFGKAMASLSLIDSFNSIILSEYKLLQSNYDDDNNSCLMICNLHVKSTSQKLVIKGNYTSSNLKNNFTCGDGNVFLVKLDDKINFLDIENNIIEMPYKVSKKKKPLQNSNASNVSISKSHVNSQLEFIPCPNNSPIVFPSTLPAPIKPTTKTPIKYYKVIEKKARTTLDADTLQ